MTELRRSKTRAGMRRMRSLASDERAGSGARRRAAELQLQTLRNHRQIVPILGTMYVAVGTFIWFAAGWAREFTLGAWTATIVAMGHHFVWQMSGAASWGLGAVGEQWTAQELRKLRSSGWRLINDVHFEHSNIDHLLIGLGGVVVVETKTASKSWADRDQQQWLAKATVQVAKYSRSMRNYLKPYTGDAPVLAVVALWPDRGDVPTGDVDGVTVVGGSSLAKFVEALPTGRLDEAEVDSACEELIRYVSGRDANRLETEGPAPRSFDDWNYEFLQLAAGLLVGALLALLALDLNPWPLAFVPIGALMVAATIARRRFERVATLITSGLIGCLGVVVAVLVAVGANAW